LRMRVVLFIFLLVLMGAWYGIARPMFALGASPKSRISPGSVAMLTIDSVTFEVNYTSLGTINTPYNRSRFFSFTFDEKSSCALVTPKLDSRSRPVSHLSLWTAGGEAGWPLGPSFGPDLWPPVTWAPAYDPRSDSIYLVTRGNVSVFEIGQQRPRTIGALTYFQDWIVPWSGFYFPKLKAFFFWWGSDGHVAYVPFDIRAGKQGFWDNRYGSALGPLGPIFVDELGKRVLYFTTVKREEYGFVWTPIAENGEAGPSFSNSAAVGLTRHSYEIVADVSYLPQSRLILVALANLSESLLVVYNLDTLEELKRVPTKMPIVAVSDCNL